MPSGCIYLAELAMPPAELKTSTWRCLVTRYPKGPGDGRYRIAAGRPEGQTDTIVDYHDDLDIARQAAAGVAWRPDACRGIIFDMVGGCEVGYFVNPDLCKECEKCPGPSTTHSTRPA